MGCSSWLWRGRTWEIPSVFAQVAACFCRHLLPDAFHRQLCDMRTPQKCLQGPARSLVSLPLLCSLASRSSPLFYLLSCCLSASLTTPLWHGPSLSRSLSPNKPIALTRLLSGIPWRGPPEGAHFAYFYHYSLPLSLSSIGSQWAIAQGGGCSGYGSS